MQRPEGKTQSRRVYCFFSGGCHRLILRYIYIGLNDYLFREDEIKKRG